MLIVPMPAAPSLPWPNSLLNLPTVFISSTLPSALRAGEYWKFCPGPRVGGRGFLEISLLAQKNGMDFPFQSQTAQGSLVPVDLPSITTLAPGGVLLTTSNAFTGARCSVKVDLLAAAT